jgi:hypothetical protein
MKYKSCEVHQPYLVNAILREDPQSKIALNKYSKVEKYVKMLYIYKFTMPN